MKLLIEYLSDYAKTQPDALFAADDGGRALTYSQAWTRARQVAGRLACGFGISRGDRVVVRCMQSVDYLTLCLACNLMGAVFVPIEDKASGDRVLDIVTETGCSLYVSRAAEEVPVRNALYADLEGEGELPGEFAFPDPDSVSEILYTTGTTGKSKGIVITHRANIALAENVKYGVAMRRGNVELIPLVMSHSHGLRTFYANLLNGSAVIITNGVMIVKRLFRLMDEYGVTSMDLSPSAAQFMIKLSKDAFWAKAAKLDYIEIGTAALPEELKRQLAENLPGVHLYNFYGSTESGRSCVLDFSVDTGRHKCIGKATRNTEIVFTDEARRVVQATPEQPGLLASRGPMNMLCYWQNEALSARTLIDGYVCTNDMGYFDADGYVYVLGRQDDVINFGGLKISPSEVEDVVLGYPNVAEAALVGQEDATAGQIPKLYVVPREGAFDIDDFWAFLNGRVDRAKQPKAVEVLDELPRTFNGKVDRKALARRK